MIVSQCCEFWSHNLYKVCTRQYNQNRVSGVRKVAGCPRAPLCARQCPSQSPEKSSCGATRKCGLRSRNLKSGISPSRHKQDTGENYYTEKNWTEKQMLLRERKMNDQTHVLWCLKCLVCMWVLCGGVVRAEIPVISDPKQLTQRTVVKSECEVPIV